MVYRKEALEELLLENLQTTEELMKEWEENPYYEDAAMAAKFWDGIRRAPAVAIVGDYDVDGICATYIMGKSVKEICPEKKMFLRIPRRFSEGYGISDAIAEEIMSKYPAGTAIVTVDNGIAAKEVLEKLESSGYPVFMTDHHMLRAGSQIPDVTFVADPKVPGIDGGFSYKEWCGAGVAFKLCEQYISEDLAKELSCFAGLATVADDMEMKGANWGLVRKAAKTFQEGKGPASLTNIAVALGQDTVSIDEDTFAWYLGPCLNAPGRLEDKGGSSVLSYLFAPSVEKLNAIVQKNTERKALRDAEVEMVIRQIEEEGKEEDCPIWVAVPGLHEGLIGILAGKVAEKYKVPAIVGTFVDGNPGLIKASARTAGDFNLLSYMENVPHDDLVAGKYGDFASAKGKEKEAMVDASIKDWYLKLGGHMAAAGLTMEEEKFQEASRKQAERPSFSNVAKSLVDISSSDIAEITTVCERFKPFGEGNEAPMFSMEFDFARENGRMIGKDENHLVAEPSDHSYKIQHFYHDPNTLSDKKHFGMAGEIGNTAFRGVKTPTFKVSEIYDLDAERSIETDTRMDDRG